MENYLIIFFSFLFYAWGGYKTILVFIAIAISVFLFGQLIHYSKQKGNTGKKWMTTAVIFYILVLLLYKYIPFIFKQFSIMAETEIAGSLLNLALPIGISFTTFAAISYVVDIYRGDAKAGSLEESLLYISLFPKLISGPIIQWKDFQPQIRRRTITVESVSSGMDRIIIGLAKKAILADTLGAQITRIDSEISSVGVDTPTMWIRAVLFFFELYLDFSGYSDIAIGLLEIMGFSVKDNFNYPYLSKSVSEFWRRWHISLGRWFREYVYIPLGGSRSGNVYINLFVVFLLTGIWHGANWTYLVWGIVNGIAVVAERAIRNKNWYIRIPDPLKNAVTIVFILLAWVLFCANGITDAINTYTVLFTGSSAEGLTFTWQFFLTRRILVLLVIAFAGAFGIFRKIGQVSRNSKLQDAYAKCKKVGLLMLFVVDMVFIVSSSYSPFLYFQF